MANKNAIHTATRRTKTRIVMDPAIMAGKPTIRNTNLTIELILGLLANGMTSQEILQEYAQLTQADILECVEFAQFAIKQRYENPL